MGQSLKVAQSSKCHHPLNININSQIAGNEGGKEEYQFRVEPPTGSNGHKASLRLQNIESQVEILILTSMMAMMMMVLIYI